MKTWQDLKKAFDRSSPTGASGIPDEVFMTMYKYEVLPIIELWEGVEKKAEQYKQERDKAREIIVSLKPLISLSLDRLTEIQKDMDILKSTFKQ